MGAHIDADGEFKSDKYPGCPAGKVPLSTKDATAQDLLWAYAQRRRAVDAEFSEDLEAALRAKGYAPSIEIDRVGRAELLDRIAQLEADRVRTDHVAQLARAAIESTLAFLGPYVAFDDPSWRAPMLAAMRMCARDLVAVGGLLPPRPHCRTGMCETENRICTCRCDACRQNRDACRQNRARTA